MHEKNVRKLFGCDIVGLDENNPQADLKDLQSSAKAGLMIISQADLISRFPSAELLHLKRSLIGDFSDLIDV